MEHDDAEPQRSGVTNQIKVCGTYRTKGDGIRPNVRTGELIEAIQSYLRRKEMNLRTEVLFCNCGGRQDSGTAMTVWPEGVQYFEPQPDDVDVILNLHLERGPVTQQPKP